MCKGGRIVPRGVITRISEPRFGSICIWRPGVKKHSTTVVADINYLASEVFEKVLSTCFYEILLPVLE
jgi:hypothetical protein